MAIVTGTNAGFVTVAPSVDPEGSVAEISGRANGVRFTSPAGTNHIIELGWYQAIGTNPANDWAMGLYDDDAGNNRPGNIIGSVAGTLDATTEGWFSAATDIALTASTIYWLVVQTDGTGNRYDFASSGGTRLVIDSGHTELPDPYPAPDTALNDHNAAFYALWEAVAGGIVVLRRRRAA